MAAASASEAAAPPPLLRASGLALRRPGSAEPVLEDVELALAPGECVLLEGPTGSGKTTLLRALAGLPGQGCSGRLDRSQRVTLLLQHVETQLLCTTVGEEVALGPRSGGLPAERVRQRVGGALERVGLPGFEAREVDRLSAGEKQRVVLAALLALDPQVLLLDEPSSALDPEARRALAEVLREQKHAGTALLVADHAPAELAFVVDRRVAIEGRRLVERPGPGLGVAPSRRPGHPHASRGRRLLLTGPNGAGKSTRLRALARSRTRNGEEAALVIQEPRRGLFARTVREEVEFGMLRRGVAARERAARCDELLARFDLSPLAGRSPRRLSFGQQHRLAMAAALAPRPALVLLDEPFAGLDPVGRETLLALLEEEQQRTGAEIVVASHDRDPLAAWCDRVEELPASELQHG